MIFHFGSLMYAGVLFFFLSWLTKTPIVPAWSWYIWTLLFVIALSVIAAKRITGRPLAAYLPSVVAAGILLLLSLIDLGYEQQIFIIVGSAMYYTSLLALYRLHVTPQDQTAVTMQNMAALTSLLFFYAAAYGLYLNFNVPLWLLMLVYFLSTFLVSFQTLRGISRLRRRYILRLALVLGILFGELAWLIHFWPFGYLTVAAASLILFYWLWKVVADVLQEKFSKRRFMVEGLILLLLTLSLLLSSPWRIQV